MLYILHGWRKQVQNFYGEVSWKAALSLRWRQKVHIKIDLGGSGFWLCGFLSPECAELHS